MVVPKADPIAFSGAERTLPGRAGFWHMPPEPRICDPSPTRGHPPLLLPCRIAERRPDRIVVQAGF